MKKVVHIMRMDDIVEYTSKNYFIIGINKFENEIFKRLLYNNIPYPDYLISNYGRVYSCRTNIFLKTQNSLDDYEGLKSSINGEPFWIKVHRAVLCTFCPIINPYMYTVDHIDGNHHNNHISNLRWLTNVENVKEGHRLGYINNRGDNNPQSIFTEKEVHMICQLLEQRLSYDEILKELNTDKGKDIKLLKKAIYSILCRQTYTYISDHYKFDRYDMCTYTYKNDIDTICRLLSEGKSKNEICDIFMIPQESRNTFKSYLAGILRGKYFKDIAIKYNLIDTSEAIFNIDQINDICKYIVDEFDNRSICIKLNIDFDNLRTHQKSNLTREINKIRNKVIYKYISDNYF